jgi:hypothetical protein
VAAAAAGGDHDSAIIARFGFGDGGGGLWVSEGMKSNRMKWMGMVSFTFQFYFVVEYFLCDEKYKKD